MSELLTKDDYVALAEDLKFPSACHIDGSFHEASGPELVTSNPATGAVLAKIAMADTADVDLAVSKAREAFE